MEVLRNCKRIYHLDHGLRRYIFVPFSTILRDQWPKHQGHMSPTSGSPIVKKGLPRFSLAVWVNQGCFYNLVVYRQISRKKEKEKSKHFMNGHKMRWDLHIVIWNFPAILCINNERHTPRCFPSSGDARNSINRFCSISQIDLRESPTRVLGPEGV